MKTLVVLLLVAAAKIAVAGEIKYPVSDIPEELKKGVDAVIRENRQTFTILDAGHARIHSYFAITILNQRADGHSKNLENYDKLTKISEFTGSVYDAGGKLIRKLKASEIIDQSAVDGGTLFSDARIKYADLEQSIYPYTVVFEYEKEYKFLFSIDSFYLLPGERVSVQTAAYDLIFPAQIAPRYKMVNLETPAEKSTANGITTLHWSFKDIQPMRIEPMGQGVMAAIPHIECAPNQFEFDGYKGTMQTWDEFGAWIALLNKDRNILPEETKQKIHKLTANAKTTEEKAKIVYEFLQSRSRYVGIQLGIGGLQPFSAEAVDRTGYGDCKGLSNYTVALLNEIGVKANYVLIASGENHRKLDTTFPSSQFNHATVCVPNGKDSLWLECTSQTKPFGYAGTFTGDRDALAITQTGAKIVHTTVYPETVNHRIKSADVVLDAAGNAKSKVKASYTGLEYEYSSLDFMLTGTYDQQKKWIEKHTEIPSFDITEFSFANRKEKIPTAILTVGLTLNRLANVSGKRVFLTPNLLSRASLIPEKVENRKTNVVVRDGRTDYDTIRYQVPDILYPEFVPAPISIKSAYGEYEAGFKLEQGKMIYTRKLLVRKGEFPPASYDELIEFYKKVAKADNTKVVFLNKT